MPLVLPLHKNKFIQDKRQDFYLVGEISTIRPH